MVFVRREPSSELTPMASVASFGHIDKWICQCDTHLHTYAKAARFPPCTLPFLGRRSQARLDDERICCWLYPSLIKKENVSYETFSSLSGKNVLEVIYRLIFMMYLLLAGRPRRSKCFAFSGMNAGRFLRRIEVEELGPTLTKKIFAS